MEITRDIAVKVLEVVDAGLVNGVGKPKPGQMCVEAAVCYAMGLPHGDDPECVSRPLRSLKIRLNDSAWSSNQARAAGLRRLAVAQLGSRGALDDKEFVRRVVDLAIRKWTPFALRAAVSCHPNPKHQKALAEAAERCERDGDKNAAANAANAADAANAANAADAATYAADAADAATYAADAADAAYAYAAAANAANAANAAYAAANARDKSLAEFAEDVVRVLIDMKAPGCVWLELTEAVAA